jgi:hypothetical protein
VTTVHEDDSLMVECYLNIRLVTDDLYYFLYLAAVLRYRSYLQGTVWTLELIQIYNM